MVRWRQIIFQNGKRIVDCLLLYYKRIGKMTEGNKGDSKCNKGGSIRSESLHVSDCKDGI